MLDLDLGLGLATVDEDKKMAVEGILDIQVFCHRRQTIERAAHVRGFGKQPDLHVELRKKH